MEIRNGAKIQEHLYAVLKHLHAVLKHWILLMSGIVSVILAMIERVRGFGVPNWIFWIASGVCFFIAFHRAWLREHRKVQMTRISVDLKNGWYDLHAPNVSYTRFAVDFRLELDVANRDERNTTVTFVDLRVPGQNELEISRVRFSPQGSPVAHQVRVVDVAAGQTLPTILEVHVSFPNRAPSAWGESVKVELRFRETFGGDLRPLQLSVPLTR